jgi:hypothetical protein
MTASDNPARRILQVGCCVLIGIFGLCSAALWHAKTRGWPIGKVEYMVTKACPTGATRAKVKAWLDTNPFSETSPVVYEDEVSIEHLQAYLCEVGLDSNSLSAGIVKDIPDP